MAYITVRIFTYSQNIQSLIIKISDAVPHLKVVYDFRNQVRESRPRKEGEFLKDNIRIEKFIKFKNVSYDHDGKIVHNDLNYIIPTNKITVFTGPSGSGKTTILDLISKLIEPSEGKIMVDDQDLSKINTASWLNKIAYISQNTFVLNDSIKNNIKFFDNSISEEKIQQAISDSGLDQFIKQLPSGLNTVVGQNGVNISGGEKQRLTIARALVRGAKVLILDEATNNLDPTTEQDIVNTIKKLNNVTVIIVDHKDSFSQIADIKYEVK